MGVEDPKVKPPKRSAAGVPAVLHALEYSLEQTSLVRTAINLLSINQTDGIDCPGCAWPEPGPGKRHKNEYCENGAKHINDEATTRRVTREFFREHSISELAVKSDMWLNEQGRLTEPMVKRGGSDYYEPISWDDAFDLLAAELHGLDHPTRRCSTHPAGSVTRRRSCCSCSHGPSAPITCPTAATCVMNPAAQD
jgi:anaerobic selenocysteine-containing dehydrogenase